MTPKPHERLATAIDVRRGELGLSLREVAELADIAPETLRAIRKGTNEPSVLTKRGLERALQWSAGSVDRIFEGGEPGTIVYASARLEQTASMTARGTAEHRQLTDEEIMGAGLKPETVEAALRLRRRIARLVAERDEDAIQRDDRVLGALHDEQDTA